MLLTCARPRRLRTYGADGVAEEKPFEGRLPIGADQLGPVLLQPRLESGEARPRDEGGEMSAVLPLERRGRKLGDLEEVNLLARCDGEPGGRDCDVPGMVDRPPSQRFLEELRRTSCVGKMKWMVAIVSDLGPDRGFRARETLPAGGRGERDMQGGLQNQSRCDDRSGDLGGRIRAYRAAIGHLGSACRTGIPDVFCPGSKSSNDNYHFLCASIPS